MVYEARTTSTWKAWQGQEAEEGFGINTTTYHSAHGYTNNMVHLQHLEKAVQKSFYFASSVLHLDQGYCWLSCISYRFD